MTSRKPLTEMLDGLSTSKFYGSLEIKFESGRIVLVKKTETLKPEEYQRDNRGNDDAKP